MLVSRHWPRGTRVLYPLSCGLTRYKVSLFADWFCRLFRKANQDTPLLLLYRDSPCVVIGRNQNPWVEVNFKALRAANVPFIRRRSGGGTVYHVGRPFHYKNQPDPKSSVTLFSLPSFCVKLPCLPSHGVLVVAP